MKNYRFTTKQKGYGRQGLYANGVHIQDVFPNVEEHFGLTHENDAFYDEENGIYTDYDGNETTVYQDLDEWLSENFESELEELEANGNFDEN